MTKHVKPLFLIGLAWHSLSLAQAQTLPSQHVADAADTSVQTVVVSASRYEQHAEDLPMSMDVLGSKELESAQIGDIHDLARNLPNISVERAPARFTVTGAGNPTGRDGNAGFNIRGEGGNRVLMLVDGIRQPHSYINGSNAFGRDSLSLELLKRIEIVRGPASVLYGSDGMAGLVNFITLEPSDFLHPKGIPEKTLGGKISVAARSDDDGYTLGASLAGRASDTLEWLLSVADGKAKGMKNMGTNDAANIDRTTPNPQTDKNEALLAKLVYRPSESQKHILTFEHVNKDSDYELLSSRAKPPVTSPSAVVGETADNSMKRDRLTLLDRFLLNTAYADHLQTVIGYQDAASRQAGVTRRKALADRLRDVRYSERSWQANIQLDKLFKMSPDWSQRISYGFDYARTDITSMFDGADPGNPGFIPKKYFPDTREASSALYAQSEVFAGKWIITPGVRIDSFELKVTSQDGFSPPAKTPGKSLSGSAVSPKLGLLRRLTPELSLFGNYASGFRAPDAQQVNGVYDSTTVPAVLLPNPDLKPEKSHHLEAGLRVMQENLRLDLAIFKGKYSNLIYDKKPLGGKGVIGDPALFQTVNINRATIQGYEIKGNLDWGRWAGGTLSMPFGYGITRGTDDSTGLPLNSIDPAKLTVGIRYAAAAWDIQLDARHQNAKVASDLDSPYLPKPATPPRIPQFTIPSASVFDLYGQWRMQSNLRLNAGIGNLTNRKYWTWSDVQGLAATSAVTDAYTQPGRNLKLSLVMDF
ncbi:MAG: TonB-dependent hemoglobin/transferrin/lactoferrin family receptor [Sterolibacterium sp.]